MKTTKLSFAAAALLMAGPAFAQETANLEKLARESGLEAREVAMVLGPSVAYSNYRTSYVRCKAQLVRAIGEKRFERVAAAYREQSENVARLDG